MALYKITVETPGGITEYTVDATSEAAAKTEARRRAGAKPQNRYLPAAAFDLKVVGTIKGNSDDPAGTKELERRAKALSEKESSEASGGVEELGGSAAQSFENYVNLDPDAKTYSPPPKQQPKPGGPSGDVPSEPEFGSYPVPPQAGPKETNEWDDLQFQALPQVGPTDEWDEWNDLQFQALPPGPPSKVGDYVRTPPIPPIVTEFNESVIDRHNFIDPMQTEGSRQRELESISPFAAFLEQLEGAGLGGLTGAAGRFAKNQYQPLMNEFTMSTLMPLILSQAAGEGEGSYLDALRRSKTTGGYSEFTGDEAAMQREEDKSVINKFAPTFGSFVGSRVEGGAQASQLRQLAQLKQLAGLEAGQADNPFASGVLNPSSNEDAELIFQLANAGMEGRYSPLASQAIARYAGSGGEAFADYTRGNLAGVGSRRSSAPANNFADFLGKRYGLF